MTTNTKKLNQKKWTIIDLINWSTQYLTSKNISNSRKETEWFLSHIFKCNRLDLYLQFDKIVNPEKLKQFKLFLIRRINNEPFQYIINKAPFYGRDFYVDKNVLIPRPETETIIEVLKKTNQKFNNLLDIGTGSGCIGITVILENIARNVLAIDNIKESIDIAKKNTNNLNCKNIEFIVLDILQDIPASKFDIVISNPPYIAKEKLKSLDKNVKDFEPLNALTDNRDGLNFYKRFNKIFECLIKPNGKMILEIAGEQQVLDLKNIFKSTKYRLHFHKDLNNAKRVLEIQKND